MAKYGSAGFQFILPFAALTGAGIWADLRLGTMPGFTINGAVLGFVIGLLRLRQLAARLRREQKRRGRPPESDGSD